MKINNVNDVTPQPSAGTPRPAGSSREPVAAAVPSASVTLSTLSSQVAGVESGLKGVDVAFDAAKVSAVKSRLDEGRYEIHPEVIADRMIAENAFPANPAVQ